MSVRWEVTKRAWALAKKEFPETRVFVDMPKRFKSSGMCLVYDLSAPDQAMASIHYNVKHANGMAHVVLSMGGSQQEVGLGRSAAVEFKVDSTRVAMPKLTLVDGQAVMAKYPDREELCDKVALLAGGVSDQRELFSWLASHGFPAKEILAGVSKRMALPRGEWPYNNRRQADKEHPRARFDRYEKVRVDDDTSMEHMECGQVLDIRGKFKDGYAYLVIIDGSSKPVWIPESSLREVHAGEELK